MPPAGSKFGWEDLQCVLFTTVRFIYLFGLLFFINLMEKVKHPG